MKFVLQELNDFSQLHFVAILTHQHLAMKIAPTLGNLIYMENLVYHFFRQLWLVLGVKLMEINSNLFSRYINP